MTQVELGYIIPGSIKLISEFQDSLHIVLHNGAVQELHLFASYLGSGCWLLAGWRLFTVSSTQFVIINETQQFNIIKWLHSGHSSSSV